MKKLFMIASLMLMSLVVNAEGYQVNLQSTRQMGMGHVGTALKLGSESMFFNPAGMAFMDTNFDISLGGSAVFSNISYENNGVTAETDNKASTPIFAYAAFKISNKFAAGISLTTPYGSSLDWGNNWAGADLVQNISLQSFCIQPTLSYRISEKLSIGAGLTASFGNVSISRALLPAGTLVPAMGPDYADVIPVSANLKGDAGVKFGFNVGAMYDVTKRFTLGVNYRSKVNLTVKEGHAELIYASTQIEQSLAGMVPPLDKGTFGASMPMPANLTFGGAYKFDRLVLSADIQAVFWSAYKQLDINFSEEVLGGYDISSPKNYRNTVIARVGAEYKVTERLDIRAGVYFDETPVQPDNYNPETPGMNKLGFSAGISFRPTSFMSIDLGLLYIAGLERFGSVDYTNGLLQPSHFEGTYDSSAISPSLSISFKF